MFRKSSTFRDITACGPLKVSQRFGRTYRLHLACCLFYSLFFLRLFFDHENRDNMLLRNVVDIECTTLRYVPGDINFQLYIQLPSELLWNIFRVYNTMTNRAFTKSNIYAFIMLSTKNKYLETGPSQ
jgi:hypothetical protein